MEAPQSVPARRPVSRIGLGGLVKSVLKLGAGETTGRLASFALFAYITRAYGVGLLGIVALAQTVAIYVTMVTDQGLVMIGARIVAKTPAAARSCMRPLLIKRLILCAVAVSLGSLYAVLGPVPAEARLYVLGFTLAAIPYALSLDWIAWGLGHMGWLGGWRAIVSVVFVAGAILAMQWSGKTLLPLVLSRIASTAAGAALLWWLWHFAWRHEIRQDSRPVENSSTQLLWGAIFTLGAATIFNQLFNSVDTLLLAGMTSTSEVGRYNAAYKIIFLILGGYYLVTQSLYPHFSAAENPDHLRKWLLRRLPVVGSAGIVLAAAVWIFSGPILTLVYGNPLGSIPLLHILAISIPMDFCTAVMGVLLASRGRDKLLLLVTSLAAALNVGLNFLLIPKMQAKGAAWATVCSYAFLLAILFVVLFRPSELGPTRRDTSLESVQLS